MELREIKTIAEKAANVLSSGGILLYPTDTLYGLGVDARNPEAVDRLTELKGRGAEKHFSVVLPSVESIHTYVSVSPEAQKLIDTFLPGPLTLVLPVHGPERHVAHEGMLGIRVPADAFTEELSRAFGAPYTSTSANVSGLPALPTVAEILAQFGDAGGQIGLSIDDGPREGGIPSTVVRVRDGEVEILREGKISQREIELCVSEVLR